jgi:hypothetical protein
MMLLFFSDGADIICQRQGFLEVRRLDHFVQALIVDNLPVFEFGKQRLKLLARQFGNATMTWYACFIG